MKIYTFDPHKYKQVFAGDYDPDTKIFHKEVNRNHYMNVRKGYGIQDDVICQLEHMGCKTVVISNGSEVRKISFSVFLSLPNEDFGHGVQRFIAWDRMTVHSSTQLTLF